MTSNTIAQAEASAGTLAPIAGGERKEFLDTLRGIALFGILLMNINGMGLPMAYNDPSIYGGAEGANLVTWVTANLFFEGTMRGLFSLMFGAGIILITSRAEARGSGIEVADIYYRRTLWLFLFGLVHGWLILWPGDILYTYALCGLFLFVFRHAKPRTLIILGVLALASLAPKNIYHYFETQSAWDEAQAAFAAQEALPEGGELDDDSQAAIDAWKGIEGEAKPGEDAVNAKIDEMRGHYFDVMASNAGFLSWFQSYGIYSFFFFDAIGMMFIGMAFLKLGIITGDRRKRFYLGMMLVGYAVGLTVNAWETRLIVDNDFSVVALTQANLTYDMGRLFMTLGHIGAIMLVCKLGLLGFLGRALAAVGRMALTNYIMHSVITAFVFTGLGFALFGALERYELLYVVIGIWIFQLIVSPIWMKYYRFGPLEWLWRSLTYKKVQPLRRFSIEKGTVQESPA
ncbi:MAG: DUF418 domain-containing protein [Woeseiaceae bacterium]|nr:DUF418 domain-containing protein [Woeseiaceae bacterium]